MFSPHFKGTLLMGADKAAGPDGFMALYYKKCVALLAPPLTQYFNAIQKGGPMDTDSNMAFITHIPKPHKDLSDVANYRPILVINNDLKLFTKILANRMLAF